MLINLYGPCLVSRSNSDTVLFQWSSPSDMSAKLSQKIGETGDFCKEHYTNFPLVNIPAGAPMKVRIEPIQDTEDVEAAKYSINSTAKTPKLARQLENIS